MIATDLPGALSLDLAGTQVWLLAERALWWPAGSTLFVADVHAGRDAVLRQHGMAVPAGTLDHDLQRLDHLLAHTAARQLVVLGDLVHAAPRTRHPWTEQIHAWANRHPDVRKLLVGGNHDRRLDPTQLGFTDVGAQWRCAPFLACHVAAEVEDRGRSEVCLDGHVHPVVQLRHAGRRLRAPVFWQRERHLTLPAYGALNGGFEVRPAPGDRLYACAGSVLPIALPAARLAAPRRWR